MRILTILLLAAALDACAPVPKLFLCQGESAEPGDPLGTVKSEKGRMDVRITATFWRLVSLSDHYGLLSYRSETTTSVFVATISRYDEESVVFEDTNGGSHLEGNFDRVSRKLDWDQKGRTYQLVCNAAKPAEL